MGKLNKVYGYVRLTLDKLPGIRADLVRLDEDWHEWKFFHLVEALRKWCERSPLSTPDQHKPLGQGKPPTWRRERAFYARDEAIKARPCVSCKSNQHKSVSCDQVKEVSARRNILSDQKSCFNCTGAKHRADNCKGKSKGSCQNCHGRHHTSICDKKERKRGW